MYTKVFDLYTYIERCYIIKGMILICKFIFLKESVTNICFAKKIVLN